MKDWCQVLYLIFPKSRIPIWNERSDSTKIPVKKEGGNDLAELTLISGWESLQLSSLQMKVAEPDWARNTHIYNV